MHGLPQRTEVHAISAAVARAKGAHPELRLSDDEFIRYVAFCSASPPVLSFESMHLDDLYLACACAQNVEGAAKYFESRLGPVIRRAIARVLSSSNDRQEAEQLTRVALLVSEKGHPPKIRSYLGRGPLASWVSVAAMRLAVSLGRSERIQKRVRDLTADVVFGAPGPEMLFMKRELQEEVAHAISEALSRLESRYRLVLRLHLVSQMTMADIGRTFGVTQQAVSRWLATIRRTVDSDVRRQLRNRFKVTNMDLGSLTGLVISQINISISQTLGDT